MIGLETYNITEICIMLLYWHTLDLNTVTEIDNKKHIAIFSQTQRSGSKGLRSEMARKV